MKKEQIFGKKINDEKKGRVLDYSEKFSGEFSEQLNEVEIKKSKEDVALINDVNEIVNSELNNFGLPCQKIDAEKIFFLPNEFFLSLFPSKEKTFATSMAESEMIFVNKLPIDNKDSNGKLLLSFILLHEILHLASHLKFYLKNDSNETILNYRSGFVVKDIKSQPAKVYFRGLNEGIIQNFCFDIINRNKDFFEKNVADGDGRYFQKIYDLWNKLYQKSTLLTDIIIIEIAKKQKRDEGLVRKDFFKSLFTGEIMKLRDIDRIFGKESLRVLAKLGEGRDVNDRVVAYFLAEDAGKKNEIAKELLREDK